LGLARVLVDLVCVGDGDGLVLGSMDNEQWARRNRGDIMDRLHVAVPVASAPSKEVVRKPGEGSSRQMRHPRDGVRHDLCMAGEGTAGHHGAALTPAGAAHDSDGGAHREADHADAGLWHSLTHIIERAAEVPHLAVSERDGSTTASAMAVVIEGQHVEAHAPEGGTDADEVGLATAIAGAADDDTIGPGPREPPALQHL